MIDTDKYEGHQPAPWLRDSNDVYTNDGLLSIADVVILGDGDKLYRKCVANAQLIADAPLLLAEVKRLREDNELYLACIHASLFRDKPGSAMSKLNQMRFLQRGEEE